MEAISVIATHRGVTEQTIVETYTYRQFKHIATAYLKDKYMIVRTIFASMSSDKKDKDKPDGLPDWYRTKPTPQPTQKPGSKKSAMKKDLQKMACVIDLNGPLANLTGYVGGVGRHLRKNRKKKG